MAAFLPILIVLLAGVGVALQPPTNAALARVSGSLWLASLVSFALGTALLLAGWAALDRTPFGALRSAPGWAWLGGLYGACFVAALAYAAPKLGLASTLTIAVAGQLLTAIALDHFGLLGLKTEPVSLTKIAGVALVIGGVLLVRRG